MSETIRIRTTPDGADKYLKIKVEQEFDFIETLSMKITQEEAYRNFCSDYGVVVGRVNINSGFGVPNSKVSIFIPIEDIDKEDSNIKGLYPYEIISDSNDEGVRYNLLSKTNETDNECFTPIGTFPTKREILDNPEIDEIYCKYYKFTTTTNYAGDFMLFGVPLGNYIVHVDVDISDIGIASQRPYDMISQGTPEKIFESPTKFKGGTNLDSLVQVKSANIGVNVQPFWGDSETCEIGINRLDVNLNYNITPSAIFIGSIFGDSEKNSVNKQCRPRKKMGELCEQVSSQGTINMIRETIDGNIEDFDIEDGNVIDDNGNWSYQIPMNLDYVVTNEFGDLIPSDNPNMGIPTKANVRFKVGMFETGGEGRLRTRAKFLVPHNPNNSSEIDYEFGPKTKKVSLRSLYWNKIYSVSSFIPRYQGNNKNRRAFTGIKNVDDCVGDKTPFPYNKISTDSNPMFFIICLLMRIIGLIVTMLNLLLIPLLNVVMRILNKVLEVISKLIYRIGGVVEKFTNLKQCPDFSIPRQSDPNKACDDFKDILKYIPCIYIECPSDSNQHFAPGCAKGTKGLETAYENIGCTDCIHYPGDEDGHTAVNSGLSDCIAASLADSLNIYSLDFYNDWINGSLYSYLLKYKKRKRGKEKFCEYDCTDFKGDPTYTGVDGDGKKGGDNSCNKNNFLLDTGYDGDRNSQKLTYDSGPIKEGLIKKVETFFKGKKISEEFYYAASTHVANYKLFATEIISLGSVLNCDWQGIPKLQEKLIATTYNLPPIMAELEDDNISKKIVAGMVDIGVNSELGVIFDINCLGVRSNYRQILNIRHQCEFGVGLDEQLDVGTTTLPIKGFLDITNIDDGGGKLFRDVFFGLNQKPNTPTFTLPSNGFSTNFNTIGKGTYDFSSLKDNGADYANFRGFGGQNVFTQPKHSYFFYFGIKPGSSAIDKMNKKFFTICKPLISPEFNIIASSIAATQVLSTGSIKFQIASGVGPFTYIVSGPSNYVNNSNTTTNGSLIVNLSGLEVGTYTITCIDSSGREISQEIIVNGVPKLYAIASVSKNSSSENANDGEITINSIGGGSGTWTYQLFKSDGTAINTTPTPINITPLVIGGLSKDINSDGSTTPYYGYKIVIKDSNGETITINDLILDAPLSIVATSVTTNNVCHNNINGSIAITITGGKKPYTVTTQSPPESLVNTVLGNFTKFNDLSSGSYTTTVVDSLGETTSIISIITTINPQLIITNASSSLMNKQCSAASHSIPFMVPTGAINGKVYVSHLFDNETDYSSLLALDYVNSSTPLYITIPKDSFDTSISIRINNTDGTCSSDPIVIRLSDIELPPVLLSTNINNISDSKVINGTNVMFKFNISHLAAGYAKRSPYHLSYTVNNGTPQTATISFNRELITGTANNVPVSTDINLVKIKMTITDNVGCTYTTEM